MSLAYSIIVRSDGSSDPSLPSGTNAGDCARTHMSQPIKSALDYMNKLKTPKESCRSDMATCPWGRGAVTTAANSVCDYLKAKNTFDCVKSHQSAGNWNYDTTKNACDQSFNCAWEAVDTAKKFQPDLTLLKEALVEIHEFRPEQVDTVLNDFGIEKTEVAKSAAGQSQNDSK